MSTPPAEHHEPELHEIRVKGHLDRRWIRWFEGMAITALDNGESVLTGPVVDQAALYGVLKQVRDLGLPLLAVLRVAPKPAGESDATS